MGSSVIVKLWILIVDLTEKTSDPLVDSMPLKVALLKRMAEIHLSPGQVIGLIDPPHSNSVLKIYPQTVE